MSADTLKVLLDTNIWVDYYSSAREEHADAVCLLNIAAQSGADLLYAIPTSKDLFYLISSDFKAWTRRQCGGRLTHEQAAAATEMAWGCLDNMTRMATAVGCDVSDVWIACKRKHLHADYEDNLVLAAAERSHADLLVTSDEQLLKHAPVAALGLTDAIAYLETLGQDEDEKDHGLV